MKSLILMVLLAGSAEAKKWEYETAVATSSICNAGAIATAIEAVVPYKMKVSGNAILHGSVSCRLDLGLNKWIAIIEVYDFLSSYTKHDENGVPYSVARGSGTVTGVQELLIEGAVQEFAQ